MSSAQVSPSVAGSESVTRILDEAVELINAHGLAGFSMRALAKALGQQPGALYWHIRDKQTLLAAVAQRLLASIPHDPEESLLDVVTAFRVQLRELTDGAEIVLSSIAMGFNLDQLHARFVAAAERDGRELNEARTLATTLVHHCLGHVMHEQQCAQTRRLGLHQGAGDSASVAITADDETFQQSVRLICGT
ncbi:TetR/AcrR family transcriptional regulator [Gulosibacter bifidus]|uniref:TetR/AcrR family transcriptional regulator n=1 Tax=Gulosibacter bifidus TaxID=272239 RepID=A0ABW5RFR0_9MICO